MTDELPIVLLDGSATGFYSWAAVRMGVIRGIDYLEQGRWNFIELLRAPFKRRADALLKFFLR